ncbi:hypothetical protein [Patulibacter sp. SYSU D01012]|uniref:hypothetical protein n=1 Tax=Patulibacter sp. SYSU D01012 TaxID=2817381 RepID=UPI001B3011A0|nr:hypothetical protein [Patulibacter sp. SYSU D01012]
MVDHDVEAPPIPLDALRSHADLGLAPDRGPAIERAVQARLHARIPSRRRARGRLRGRVRHLGWRGGLLTAGAIAVGGTALAATAPWRPQLGNDDVGHPTPATSPVPADQRATLGVLRRPQSDADRGPRVRWVLRMASPDVFDGVRVASVRLARPLPHGGSIVVLPVERSGHDDPGYPRSTRRDVVCLQITSWTTVRGRPGLGGGLGSGGTCGNAADIRSGHMMMGAQFDGELGVSGLVPDGVRTVEVPLRGGPTLRLPVSDNVYYADMETPRGRFNPVRVRWLDAAGRVVGPPRVLRTAASPRD